MEKDSQDQADVSGSRLRKKIRDCSKDFKTSWVNLGQALYSVWRDKLFYGWGFDKFEYYTEQEAGLPKDLSLKLLKTYFFVEQEEPDYLKKEYCAAREAVRVPGYEAVNILRLAKQKKELQREDYVKLRRDAFDKGKDASLLRRDLTAIIKERKPADPQEERDRRSDAALRKLYNALNLFNKDMEVLKLAPDDILKQAQALMGKLKEQL